MKKAWRVIDVVLDVFIVVWLVVLGWWFLLAGATFVRPPAQGWTQFALAYACLTSARFIMFRRRYDEDAD